MSVSMIWRFDRGSWSGAPGAMRLDHGLARDDAARPALLVHPDQRSERVLHRSAIPNIAASGVQGLHLDEEVLHPTVMRKSGRFWPFGFWPFGGLIRSTGKFVSSSRSPTLASAYSSYTGSQRSKSVMWRSLSATSPNEFTRAPDVGHPGNRASNRSMTVKSIIMNSCEMP